MRSFLGKPFGNYRLVRELDRGSFGTVYLAQHTLLTGRLVAIKVLHEVHLQTPAECDAFLQEALLLDQLKHPYILPLLDVGLHQEFLPYLVMEYAASGSLRQRLNSQSSHPLPVAESLTMLSQIGQALHYAHQQTHAIVHRDLKPENILLNQRGEALLADFGIATVLSTASIRHTSSTGTPAYMAPEQFRGQVSRESDQYALGCVAYELLTGQRPFTAGDFIAMGFKHATEEPLPPTQLNPNLPQAVEDALLKAMAKRREDRHTDVAIFITALQGSADPQRKSASEKQSTSVGQTEFSRDQLRSRLLSLISLRIASLKASGYEKLDPQAVWASIQRHDVPSTWHVLQGKSGTRSAAICGAILGGAVPLGLASLVAQQMYGSAFSDSIPSSFGIVAMMLMCIGIFVGAIWGEQSERSKASKLALMPEGLIYFSSQGIPRYIISYKAVEEIRFDSTKNILAVTMTPLCREVPLKGFDEVPHIIAQSVERTYINCKIRHNLP